MSKHNGINATRDVLKDQLALAASEIERLRGQLPRSDDSVPSLAVVFLVVFSAFGAAVLLLTAILQ